MTLNSLRSGHMQCCLWGCDFNVLMDWFKQFYLIFYWGKSIPVVCIEKCCVFFLLRSVNFHITSWMHPFWTPPPKPDGITTFVEYCNKNCILNQTKPDERHSSDTWLHSFLSARSKQLVQMKLNKSKLFLIMPHVSFEFFLTYFLLTFINTIQWLFGLSRSLSRNIPTICKCKKLKGCAFERPCLRYGCGPEGFEMCGEDAIW